MLRIPGLLFALFTLIAQPVQADRLKIGVALSGGGARGAAHIGVLRELERQNIPIDYIAGTSMGAIIGAMYASGMNTEKIERVLVETDWDDIFRDQPPRRDASIRRKTEDRVFQVNKELGIKDGKVKLPSGLIQGQKLQLLLDKLFLPVAHVQNFNQLSVPFRAVATDIITSRAVVLESGSLSTAVRASMSVPSVFATVKMGDFILVDGGISNNLPVGVVRSMGADVVIAVDIGTPLLKEEELDSAIGVATQLSNILVRRTTDVQIETLTDRDVLITPELGRFSSSDFKNGATVIPMGEAATLAVAAKLRPLALAGNDHNRYLADRQISEHEPPVISFIHIRNDSPLADEYIRSRLHQKLGDPLDFDQIEKDIGIIYGLEIFQIVEYSVVEESGETGLVVNVHQKPWGPRYLQFGLRYSSDFSDENNLALTLGYTVTPLNLWNGEWRTFLQLGEEPGVLTELNQPLGIDSPYFVNGILSFRNERFNIFRDGTKTNQARARQYAVTGAVGREFSPWGDLRLGLSRSTSNNNVDAGPPSDEVFDVEGGELFALVRFDNMDSAFFPTSGVKGHAKWLGSRAYLGADNEFDQAQLDLTGAATFGSHTLLLSARYFTTFKGTVPLQNRFRTGGMFELPGFVENELSGQDLYLLRTIYQRKLANLFNTSPYLGLSVQYGQVFANDEDISLSEGIVAAAAWLGWESIFGPIYAGYGRADTGNQSLYIIMGRPF
jgi:NTE family protein